MAPNLVIWMILNSLQHSRKLNISRSLLLMHKIFQMINFQSIWISETLMVMILQVTSEIKVIVVHATQSHLLKSWKQDWSWSMVSNQKRSHLKCSWPVTIWMKVAKVDGHTLMFSSLKTAMLFLKNVLHISLLPKKINVKIMKNAHQLPRLENHISLVEVRELHLRRRWWKKSWEMVLLTVISKLQRHLLYTKMVSSVKKE